MPRAGQELTDCVYPRTFEDGGRQILPITWEQKRQALIGVGATAAAPIAAFYGPAAILNLLPHAGAAIATVHTYGLAHPTLSAAVGGGVEPAIECSMTGGGCNVFDYGAGVLTAGAATRLSSPGGPCSFSADTVVMTEDGPVPIAELEPGDLVLAYNEETGDVGYYPITDVWSHDDPVIVYLTMDGETIITTPEHPFYTEEGQWVAAGELQTGDEIRQADWTTGTVQAVEFVAQTQTMYNFTVATAHTYRETK